MSDAKVVEAAVGWYMARNVFLKLPAGDPNTVECLGELADAENALFQTIRAGVRDAFATPSTTPSNTDRKETE